MFLYCAFKPKDICRMVALSAKFCSATNHNLSLCKFYQANFVAPHLLPANGASCQFILNHGRDNHHCVALPVVEEGETSDANCTKDFANPW